MEYPRLSECFLKFLTTEYLTSKVFSNDSLLQEFNSSDRFLSKSSLKAHNACVCSHLNPERKRDPS